MGNYRLVSVTRSDGVTLPANDFWQTDETYVSDGQPPVFENNLHILDDNGTGSYTLNYLPIDELQPAISSLSAVSPSVTSTPVDGVQVTFNEPIAIGTLDANDLDLSLDGGPNLITSTSDVTVSLVSGSTYQITGLAALDTAPGSYTLTVNAAGVEDAFGNPGTGTASSSWTMDANTPAVASIGGVTPGPRNTAVGSVSVTFSEPINPSSFGLSALDLTEDGGSNLITGGSGVTITQEGPETFQVNGLATLTAGDGDYVLTVAGSQVTDPDGVHGVGSVSVAWTMDTVPPTVEGFSTVASPTNAPVGSLDVTFSKPIDPTTFTASALSLTLNGGSNMITSGVTVALVSGSTYQIAGLAALDADNGTYTLTVNGTDVSDLAGNAGTNSLSISWVEDTSLPAAPSDLAISPNTGVSTGLTDTGAVTLTGSLGATGLTVDVFDATTDTDLGPATVDGTSFSLALNLPAGATELEVTAADAAGNASPAATFNVFVDHTTPTVASFALAPPGPTNQAVGTIDVTFSKAINAATFTTADLNLTDDGGPNLIDGDVTITFVSGSTFEIDGLGTLTTAEGTYNLTVNATGIEDQAGNAGIGSLSASWLMDTTPPISTVGSLPAQTTTTGILVSANGSDPAASDGGMPSGIATFTLYVSKNGGAFTPFATVTPANPSALFTGQPGNRYGFYSVATDIAGNVQATPSAAQATVAILSPLTISSIATVSTPTRFAVSTIDVTFSVPINPSTLSPGALTLTDDGGANLINSGVSLTLVSGDTYAIGGLSGLTVAQGEYTLTVNAADIQDQDGISGSGVLSTSWLMDTTPPTSTVNPLPARGTSLSFAVTIIGSDPNAANGGPASGVASDTIFVSINGGAWSQWTVVPASNPTATYTGSSNTTYSFYSIARDKAGNVENKAPAVEASTYIPDLTAPVTTVDATTGTNSSTVNSTTGTFTLELTGSDPGGAALTYFEVFVSIDGGTYQEVGPYAIPAGFADSSGTYHSTVAYQGLTDGQSHSYSFYSIGLDSAGNLQGAPTNANVTFKNEQFTAATPVQLQVTGFTVEHGSPSRSFIQYLDLGFNESNSQSDQELATIINSVGTSSPDITIYKYDLAGDASSKMAVPLSSPTMLSVLDHAIEINFGSGGIGNSPTSMAADGYYEVDIKLPNGQTAVHHFYRLLGDVAGDRIVDQNDLNEIAASIGETSEMGWAPLSAAVTGDGTVSSLDLLLATRSKNRKLGTGLSLG